MLGTLNKSQIEHVLRHQVVGRLGCYADGKMYIVPITYVFDGTYIYAHSKEGLKIQMMRKNPKVCIQTDVIDNLSNWRSVLVWGEYEELNSIEAQRDALEILNESLGPLAVGESVKPTQHHPMQFASKGLKPVAFRIKVMELTGRFEKSG